jgi:hypothetical protein
LTPRHLRAIAPEMRQRENTRRQIGK